MLDGYRLVRKPSEIRRTYLTSSIGEYVLGWSVREHPVVTEYACHIQCCDSPDRGDLRHFSKTFRDYHEVNVLACSSRQGNEYVYRKILQRLFCLEKLHESHRTFVPEAFLRTSYAVADDYVYINTHRRTIERPTEGWIYSYTTRVTCENGVVWDI